LYEEIKKKLVFGVRKVAEGAFEKVNFSSCASHVVAVAAAAASR
jgi:hypothetical protein